jgi:hypothetical protein
MPAQAEIWSLAQHAIRPERGVFDEVCLAGGELYIQVMGSMIEGFKEMGRVAPDARVTVINGPMGRMRQELRLWLLAGGQSFHNVETFARASSNEISPSNLVTSVPNPGHGESSG